MFTIQAAEIASPSDVITIICKGSRKNPIINILKIIKEQFSF